MSQISDEYRAEQLTLNRAATARLVDVFPSLNMKDLDGTTAGWAAAVESIAQDLHAKSATLAEDAYMTFRRDAGARGQLTFFRPDLSVRDLRVALISLGPYAAKHAMSSGARLSDVARVVLGQTSGAALKYAQAGGRDLITGTTIHDRRAEGWKRIARGDACRFCIALADRGAVYRKATAIFAAHTHCQCIAGPVFLGGETGPEANVMQYLASSRSRTAKDRQRVREWLASY